MVFSKYFSVPMLNYLTFLSVLIWAPTLYAQEIPCPRNQPVIAYHDDAETILLFGGYCSLKKTRLNDLWVYDGEKWNRLDPTNSPEPRSGHQMVYDKFNKRLVLFGGKGNDNEILNDTWIFKEGKWLKLNISGPPPRQSHRLVYLENGRMLLFGGSNHEGSLNDTWVLTQQEWRSYQSTNSPAARRQHTMSYDAEREKVVMFGGFDRIENAKTIYDDTWEWDVQNGWRMSTANPSMARDHHAMVYDQKNKVTVLFGGYNQTYLGDTWIWDGKIWKEIAVAGPSARAGKPGFFFHTSLDQPILFGGGDAENQTLMDFWQLNLADATWNKLE